MISETGAQAHVQGLCKVWLVYSKWWSGKNSRLRAGAIGMVAGFLMAGCNGRLILSDDSRKPPRHEGSVNVYFVRSNGAEAALTPVSRRAGVGQPLEEAVRELLSGPTGAEQSQGLGSEIPRGTILLGVKRQDDRIELDVSRRFASGGGVASLETRLDQLKRTVSEASPDRDVFLTVEGRRLVVIGGEGIEVPQPINRRAVSTAGAVR